VLARTIFKKETKQPKAARSNGAGQELGQRFKLHAATVLARTLL